MAWIEIDGKDIPLLEPPETHKEMPRRIFHVLFKYKRLISIGFMAMSVPLLAIVLLSPQLYMAATKIFIKPSRAFLNLTPGPQESALSVAPSPESLNSEIQIIKSKTFLTQLEGEFPYTGSRSIFYRDSVYRLQATPVRASSIIQISLVSTDPQWAAKVINRAASLYQEYHVKVRKTPGIEHFYDEQEQRLRKELLKAEQDFKEFQAREGIVDAAKEVDSSLAALATVERNLKETESGIRETEKKIAVLNEQLKTQQATISTSKQVTLDPVFTQIRTRLTQLELEKENLLQRYLPNDRLIVDKEREIAELKKRLEEVNRTTVGSESISLNEVHRRILNEILAARVQLQTLKEKRASEANQVVAYASAAAEKKKKSYEYDRLQQAINTKKEALSLYKKRAEEARISDAMDEQKFSNATILDKANLQPAGLEFWIWALLIGIGSLAVSIGAAFVMHYFDPTIHDEANIEEESGLPVLATIQYYGN